MDNWNEWIEAVRKLVVAHVKDIATWMDFSEESSWKEYYDDEYTPQQAFDEEMSYYYQD